MVSLSAVALGISFLTTSILTIHDTAKQVSHAKDFATFLLTQDIQSNAQYTLTCVTAAIEQRIVARSEQIKKNVVETSSDLVNQSLNTLQREIQKKLKSLNINSLIYLIREQEEKINQDEIANLKTKPQKQPPGPPNTVAQGQSQGIFTKISNIKDLISQQINRQLELYQSIRRAKQKEAILYLYDIYKQGQGIKNSKWITPYNIIMMILMGIGSFFIPKIVIGIAISYFLSTEFYLLSDTIATAIKWQNFQVSFDRIFQFHLTTFATGMGLNRYDVKKQTIQGLSSSF